MKPFAPTVPQCVVCQAALPRSVLFRPGSPQDPPPEYPSCADVQCRNVVGMRKHMSDAQFRLYLDHQANALTEQRQLALLGQARDAVEAQENEAGWAQLRRRLASDAGVLETVVPSGPKRLAPLARSRREHYETHLRDMIAQAYAERAAGQAPALALVDPAEDPAGPPSPLAGLMCSVCGGGCCVSGREHAYVIPGTVHRLLAQDPGLDPQTLLDGYLSRLPERSFTHSCVNHTPKGCALPREWRSDTCNRWLCDSLKSLAAGQQAPEGVHTVLVVRRRQSQWKRKTLDVDNRINALAVLSEAGIQRVPLRAQPLNRDQTPS